jgi:hypothetical protein
MIASAPVQNKASTIYCISMLKYAHFETRTHLL